MSRHDLKDLLHIPEVVDYVGAENVIELFPVQLKILRRHAAKFQLRMPLSRQPHHLRRKIDPHETTGNAAKVKRNAN